MDDAQCIACFLACAAKRRFRHADGSTCEGDPASLHQSLVGRDGATPEVLAA
jgi:hypothetical protein